MKLPVRLTRTVARTVFKTKQNSPALMFAAGIVGFGTTVILASKATLNIDKILDQTNVDIENIISEAAMNANYAGKPELQDKVTVYTRSALQLGKLYAPALVVGSVSVALLTGSHVVLQKRNTGLMVAYAGLDKAYNEYRQRVIKDVGEDKELTYRYPTKKDPNKKDANNANKLGVILDHGAGVSIYAKFFDEFNKNFERNSEYNMIFLRCQQNWANEKLIAQGHLFLNEVYDNLGMERTEAGQIVGWVIGTESEGDCYVDFGLYDDRPSSRSFINGDSDAILLDFNVDGPIHDKIGRKA